MNYFEHHIGDYDEATAHLTACEDGIYSRMIRKYYATEKPLPADMGKLARLVRAHTREEKKAVATVAAEFFFQVGDELHQKKCDEILAAYQAKEPEREVKKSNEALRLQRHREERAALFSQLNGVGQHAAWNTPTAQLRELVKRHCGIDPTEPATPTATAPATPATANQSPLPSTHLPVTRDIASLGSPTAPPPSPPAPPAKKRAAAEGARPAKKAPVDFEVTPAMVLWAEEHNPGVDLVRETDKFRNHTFGIAKVDWLGTWKNWIYKAHEELVKRGTLTAVTGETPYQRRMRERVNDATGGRLGRAPAAPLAARRSPSTIEAANDRPLPLASRVD